MANTKNLIPAEEGDVRNPAGKPKGTRNRSTVAKMVLSMGSVATYRRFQPSHYAGREGENLSSVATYTDRTAGRSSCQNWEGGGVYRTNPYGRNGEILDTIDTHKKESAIKGRALRVSPKLSPASSEFQKVSPILSPPKRKTP
jgi:hypothetical protein